MTNSFERHGLDHLSPSSCNLFAAEPALWVLEKLLGIKGKVGAAAHRGTSAERGITVALVDGVDCEEAKTVAEKEYSILSALTTDPNREKKGAAVGQIVCQGYKVLSPYGKPSSVQRRVEWHPDELGVPIIGFIDFEWAEHGIILDLKTQLRLASQIPRNHARQGALYGMSTSDNADVRMAYVTPQKSAIYRLENVREHAMALLRIAQTIGRFLAVSNDPKELASIIAPDIDSFYWNDPDTRRVAFEVYGI